MASRIEPQDTILLCLSFIIEDDLDFISMTIYECEDG